MHHQRWDSLMLCALMRCTETPISSMFLSECFTWMSSWGNKQQIQKVLKDNRLELFQTVYVMRNKQKEVGDYSKLKVWRHRRTTYHRLTLIGPGSGETKQNKTAARKHSGNKRGNVLGNWINVSSYRCELGSGLLPVKHGQEYLLYRVVERIKWDTPCKKKIGEYLYF